MKELKNELTKLRAKFDSDIKRYGITSVTINDRLVIIESYEPIPYNLRYSIENELL